MTLNWREKMSRTGYLVLALLLHCVIFLLVATIVIFRASSPPQDALFQAVHIPVPLKPPERPSTGAMVAVLMEPQVTAIAPSTPLQIVTVNQSQAFHVDTSKALSTAVEHVQLPKPQGTGLSAGGGGTVGMGSAESSFFGVKTTGQHIAYLLDYSGSMKGEFRDNMEKQLESSLKHLAPGTQALVICWAGPAWLYNETAGEIKMKWHSLGGYDNFAMLPGNHLDPPPWIDVDSNAISDIMKNLKKQVSAPGGTDWRQPFRYVMKSTPTPETLFFLTDGQIPPQTAKRAQDDIDQEMKKANTPPVINCLFIENPINKSAEMEILAKRYHGQFLKVTAKTATDAITPGN